MVVNDVYKPLLKPDASEKQLLRTARISAIGVTLFGIALVPVFMQFKTIYAAHGAMTAAVTSLGSGLAAVGILAAIHCAGRTGDHRRRIASDRRIDLFSRDHSTHRSRCAHG